MTMTAVEHAFLLHLRGWGSPECGETSTAKSSANMRCQLSLIAHHKTWHTGQVVVGHADPSASTLAQLILGAFNLPRREEN